MIKLYSTTQHMKIFSPLQSQLLQILSDGHWHSGAQLAKQFQVTRTTIWKHIKQLSELGISIISAPKTGYQIHPPMIPLNAAQIDTYLKQHDFHDLIDLFVFASIDSTNRFLKTMAFEKNSLVICCSETQTEGRGRFGRHWYSPFGENIYCSIRLKLNCDLFSLSGLGLVISLSIMQVLHSLTNTSEIQIKWPNDLIWQGKKLCGTLIEIIAESHGYTDVVIGIGLNVNSNTVQDTTPNRPWCSLSEITGCLLDRNHIIAWLIKHIRQNMTEFTTHGFVKFIPEWEKYDYLCDRAITVSHQSKIMHGIAKGVTETGQLILRDYEGTTHFLSSGDTSLSQQRSALS